MKLYQQILLITLFITSIVWMGFGFFFIEWNFASRLKSDISSILREDQILRDALEYDANSGKALCEPNQIYFKFIISNFTTEIYDENGRLILPKKPIYNFPDRPELKLSLASRRKYILHHYQNDRLMMIAAWFKNKTENFLVISSSSLNYIYHEKTNDYIRFLILTILSLSLIAILLIISLKLNSKSLNRLYLAMKKMKKNQWHQFVPEKGPKDIRLLSRQFNLMNIEIKEHINEISEYNTRQDRFIAGFTHQLHTPLTGIIGYADVIASHDIPIETIQNYAELISKEGKELKLLGESLRKIILLREKIHKSQFTSGSIVKELIEKSKHLFYSQHITFITDFDDCILNINKELIICALYNIIENAVFACQKNSKIYLSIKDKTEYIEIKIIDNGKGIAPDLLKSIKEPFVKTSSSSHNNLGIGLYLATRIFEVHDTIFDIQSLPEKGTTVGIIFNNCLYDKQL